MASAFVVAVSITLLLTPAAVTDTLDEGTMIVYVMVHVPDNFLRRASIKRRISVAMTLIARGTLK